MTRSRYYMVKWLSEQNVFYSILFFNIFIILTVQFYPSMDGSCHLYNSNLIASLIKENSTIIHEYFTLNNSFIPNWISYWILVPFHSFLPAWVAEKILITIYLVGISTSFRFLLKQLCPENIGLSIIIFPFAYSFLFHLGFYNFSLSFVFLFLSLAYWLKYREKQSVRKYIVLSITLTLTYFSALLTFLFLGLSLGIFVVASFLKQYFRNHVKKTECKNLLLDLFFLFIVSLPGLIFTTFFFNSTTFFPSVEKLTAMELIKWLYDVRCLIVYNYNEDRILTVHFFYLLMAIISISLFLRFRKNKFIEGIRRSDVLLCPLVLSIIFLFIIPNGSNAGMMSDRYCLLAYMFFITWAISHPLPKAIRMIFTIYIIVLHLALLYKHHHINIRRLDADAKLIYSTSKYIDNNSIVLPVNMSNNWIELHFSNYLGVDKPIIILENYEASIGWFPVLLNKNQMPKIQLGNYDTLNGLRWISNTESTVIRQIDYIYLYGNLDKLNNPCWTELRYVLNKSFRKIFTSSNNYIAIYKRY